MSSVPQSSPYLLRSNDSGAEGPQPNVETSVPLHKRIGAMCSSVLKKVSAMMGAATPPDKRPVEREGTTFVDDDHNDEAFDLDTLTPERIDPLNRLQIEQAVEGTLLLVTALGEAAFERVAARFHGVDNLWHSLSQAGYTSADALRHDVVESVCSYHARLTTLELNMDQNATVCGREVERTITGIIEGAVGNHGIGLRSALHAFKTNRIAH